MFMTRKVTYKRCQFSQLTQIYRDSNTLKERKQLKKPPVAAFADYKGYKSLIGILAFYHMSGLAP